MTSGCRSSARPARTSSSSTAKPRSTSSAAAGAWSACPRLGTRRRLDARSRRCRRLSRPAVRCASCASSGRPRAGGRVAAGGEPRRGRVPAELPWLPAAPDLSRRSGAVDGVRPSRPPSRPRQTRTISSGVRSLGIGFVGVLVAATGRPGRRGGRGARPTFRARASSRRTPGRSRPARRCRGSPRRRC